MKRMAELAQKAVSNKTGICRGKNDVIENIINIDKNPDRDYDQHNS